MAENIQTINHAIFEGLLENKFFDRRSIPFGKNKIEVFKIRKTKIRYSRIDIQYKNILYLLILGNNVLSISK